jgi:hypothetical protein
MTIEQFIQKQIQYQTIRRIAVIIAVLSPLGFFAGIWWLSILVVVLIIACIGLYMNLQERYTKLALTFKKDHLKQSIESRFPTIKYDMNKGFLPIDVYGSKLIERGDIFKSEDMLQGKINNTRFRTADVKIQFERLSRNGRQIITRFSGKYYEIELPFVVNKPVYIVNNGAEKFGIKLGLPRVDFEYIDFNNEVDVYASDSEAAFKLLKPKAMENILKLRQKYGSVAFAFFNKTMVVAMEGRNSFEFYIHRKIDKHFLETIEQEIQTLIDLSSSMK